MMFTYPTQQDVDELAEGLVDLINAHPCVCGHPAGHHGLVKPRPCRQCACEKLELLCTDCGKGATECPCV